MQLSFFRNTIFLLFLTFASLLKADTIARETAADVYNNASREVINTLRKNSTAVNLNTPEYLTFLCKQVEEELQKNPEQPVVADSETIKESRMFDDYFRFLPRHTRTGTAQLIKILSLPTNNHEELLKRQKILQYLQNNSHIVDELSTLLDAIQIQEETLLNLFMKNTEINHKLTHLSDQTNKAIIGRFISNSTVLNIYSYTLPIFISSIFLSSLGMLSYGAYNRNLEQMSAGFGLGVWTAVQGGFSEIKNSMQLIKETQSLLKPLNTLLKNINTIKQYIKSNPGLNDYFDTKKLDTILQPTDPRLKEFIELLQSSTFEQEEASYLSHHGNTLRALQLWTQHPEIRKAFAKPLNVIGEVDAFNSLAKYSQRECQKHTFAQYNSDQEHKIEGSQFTHPNLLNSTANDMVLGGKNIPKNAVVTGMNAAGKSTILRAFILNALMAQTSTLTTATSFETPIFDKIILLANIADSEGSKSRFQKEAQRVADIYKYEKEHPNAPLLAVLDEPYSGTNPEACEKTLIKTATKMEEQKNAFHIFITPHHKLAQLPNYATYCVKGELQQDGSYKSTYHLEKGISTQNDADNILRKAGIDI